MRYLESSKVTVFGETFEVFGYSDDTIFRDVTSKGWNEFDSLKLPDLIALDDVCLDLGANIGMSTLALATLVPKGHVYAFEGSPETTAALEKTVLANSLTNVSVSNVVVGRASAKVKFFDNPAVRTSGHCLPIETPRQGISLPQDSLQIIVSESRSVDQLVTLHGLTKVDFVKIDVEGAELDALEGAAGTLAKFSPLVMMEFNSYAFVHLREISPRRALQQLLETFDEVFYFKNRAGELRRLDDTEHSREQFLQYNMFNGFVDDLLCVFKNTRVKQSGELDRIERDCRRSRASSVLPRRRYPMVVDGEILDSRHVKRLRDIPGRTLAAELGRRIKRRVGFKID
jgi:FkbM family methyltransferase